MDNFEKRQHIFQTILEYNPGPYCEFILVKDLPLLLTKNAFFSKNNSLLIKKTFLVQNNGKSLPKKSPPGKKSPKSNRVLDYLCDKFYFFVFVF